MTHIAQRLLRECRDLLERDLGEWMEELGPITAVEVLTLAGATRDSARQAEYLRLRTDLQNRWKTLTDAFEASLGKQLQHIKAVDSTPAATKTDFSELQLVDNQELTERIVMREFTRRISEACSEEIYALDRRIAHLMGHGDDEQGENQFGPQLVCTAVGAGCEAMYADIDNRTLLLRQLERHLQAELPEVYRAINEVMIEAGILPELKRSYRRAVPAGTMAPAADSANILDTMQRLASVHHAAPAEGMPAQLGVGTFDGGPQGIPVGELGGLGEMAGAGAGAAASTGTLIPPGMFAVPAAFLHSLQTFQAMPTATSDTLTNVVRMARDSDEARHVPPLEAITLDIVATLFDLIFDDDKVPTAVKGMVSRLQIPVLKVAMLDQQFFADRSHPARRFLDSISGIAMRWGKTVDEGDPFYIKLSELVGHIQETFDQDVEVFGTAINELSAFVTEREAMEAETSRVVAEVVQRKEDEQAARRERQAAARQAADAALAPLLGGAMPRPIEQFFKGHWRAVLQKTALTAGSNSPEFRAAERIGADLVWSIAPKSDATERKRLVAMLPKLIPELQRGLDQIGTSSEARNKLLDALMALHSAALHADVQAQNAVPELEEAPAPPASTEAPVLQVTHAVENGIQIEEVAFAEKEEETVADIGSQDRSLLRKVKHLVRGDWIDFIDGEEIRRERLTWISPRRTLYLFSNHTTNRAISITPEALAHRLQSDTARLVERDAPMFERALDGAIKVLDKAA